MTRFASPRAALHVLAGAALLATAACARTATFRVTHPALINAAAVGNTMTVGGFADNGHPMAAEEIRTNLATRIANSLNRSIRLLPAGGGITITGAILANDYTESFTRNTRTCTRSVLTTDAQGRQTTTTQSYPCTDVTRLGHAVAQVQFRIIATASGQTIFDRVYEREADRTTTGIESQYEMRAPDVIDAARLLYDLRSDLVEQFARVILPWQEDVTVEFEDCAGDPHCSEGFEAARHGDLAAAERHFTAVVGTNVAAAAANPQQAERIGEALYNRGLVRAYMGRYAQAVTDINRAIQLRPGNERWAEELQNIQSLARDQEALRAQGAISAETQNVQQAGTP